MNQPIKADVEAYRATVRIAIFLRALDPTVKQGSLIGYDGSVYENPTDTMLAVEDVLRNVIISDEDFEKLLMRNKNRTKRNGMPKFKAEEIKVSKPKIEKTNSEGQFYQSFASDGTDHYSNVSVNFGGHSGFGTVHISAEKDGKSVSYRLIGDPEAMKLLCCEFATLRLMAEKYDQVCSVTSKTASEWGIRQP